jgi:proteic killer suppression protein
MEVFFDNKKLASRLGRDRDRVKEFGAEGAKRIDLRLQQLRRVPTLETMRQLPGRCHELTADLRGHLAVDVQHPYRLVFRPTKQPPPTKPDGGLNWAVIDSITIVDITDYH